jgi:putative nucleotidyltransferase with HDIG domain
MNAAETIIERLDTIKDLPTLPLVMQKVSAAVRDPNSDARTVARMIEDDPAIMARVLKVVNSALYAGTVEIESVSQAVARLGMTAINNLALSTSVFSAFHEGPDALFDRQAFWRHSISVGIATCVIQKRVTSHLKQRHSKENLRLAGLIHDIGKIVMEQYLQDDFRRAISDARSQPMPLFEAEQAQVGADHAQIGAWLAAKWGLAEDLVQVIRWHHEPASAPTEHWELTVMCHIANYICNQQKIGDGGDLAAPELKQMLWKGLGLSVGDISSIVDEIAEESKKSDILLALT